MGQMFPSRWLTAADLPRAVVMKVARVEVEKLRQLDGDEEWKPVIYFVTREGRPAQKALVGNKTQCSALAIAAGSERFDAWEGTLVMLTPGRAPNGKATIVVSGAG